MFLKVVGNSNDFEENNIFEKKCGIENCSEDVLAFLFIYDRCRKFLIQKNIDFLKASAIKLT